MTGLPDVQSNHHTGPQLGLSKGDENICGRELRARWKYLVSVSFMLHMAIAFDSRGVLAIDYDAP
jgi:hypothetical protein